MLGFFPDPYPDEVFHGTLCRLYKILGKPAGHTFSKLLFGRIQTGVGMFFPKKLEDLMRHMPALHNLTEEKIRQEHTLVPLYEAFTETVKQSMLEPWHLYSCPMCREKDKAEVGEAYWHRSHQVPHAKTCYKHGIALEQATTRYRLEHNARKYFLPEETDWIQLETSPKELEIHNRFNTRVQAILNGRLKLGQEHRETMLAACQLAGFTKGHSLWADKLLPVLKEKLGNTFLDLFSFSPDDYATKELLAKVIRGTESNPHRYLLFYEAFNLEIGQIIPLPPPKEKPPRKRPGWNPPFGRMAKNKIRHRAAYLKIIKNYPNATRSQIGEMNIQAYGWLRKYDRVWFDQRHNQIKIGKRGGYATIEERDMANLKRIKQALELVKLDTDMPQRITANYLGRLLAGSERKRLGRNAHLPQCKALLDSYREDEITFYGKRIMWALTKIEGRILYRNFCKLAGIRPKVDQNPEIARLAREAHRKNQEIYQGL